MVDVAAAACVRSARHAFRFIVWVSLTGSPSRVPVRKTQTTNQEYRQRSLHEDLQGAALAQHQRQGRLFQRAKMATDHLVIVKRSEKGTPEKYIFVLVWGSVPKNTKVPHEYGLELVSLGLIVVRCRFGASCAKRLKRVLSSLTCSRLKG